MSASTKIQWCDSTCNPTMGCDGCELWTAKVKKCYAGVLHVRFGGATKGYAPTFEEVTRFPGRMQQATRWKDLSGQPRADKPWLNGYPRLIFVSDMSDAMSDGVSFEYLRDEVIDCVTSDAGRNHQWLWLTKRPNRMAEFRAGLPFRRSAGRRICGREQVSRVSGRRAASSICCGSATRTPFGFCRLNHSTRKWTWLAGCLISTG